MKLILLSFFLTATLSPSIFSTDCHSYALGYADGLNLFSQGLFGHPLPELVYMANYNAAYEHCGNPSQ
jgi:hypothetical protein